jgi:hypothetical protein
MLGSEGKQGNLHTVCGRDLASISLIIALDAPTPMSLRVRKANLRKLEADVHPIGILIDTFRRLWPIM